MISFEKRHAAESLDFSILGKYCSDEKVDAIKMKLERIFGYTVALSKSYGMEASSTLCLRFYYDKVLRQKLAKINDEASALYFETSLLSLALMCLRMVMKHNEDQDQLFESPVLTNIK